MGSIITFYSYKGGVGRSMALANIAFELAKRNYRVLIVDWDLEAPGIEKYFSACKIDNSSEGLMQLFLAHNKGLDPDYHDYLWHIDTLLGFGFSLLHSGRDKDPASYLSLLQNFNWSDFFTKSNGGHFLETMRTSWHSEFDFVLIDSRTGLSDSSGICTIMMPDILIPMFTANYQSLFGIRDVVKYIQNSRQKLEVDRMILTVLPIPSRFGTRVEFKESQEWLDRMADILKDCFTDWLPKWIGARYILEQVKIPQIDYFSFGEKLAVMEHGAYDPESIGAVISKIVSLLISDFSDVETFTGKEYFLSKKEEYLRALPSKESHIVPEFLYDLCLSYPREAYPWVRELLMPAMTEYLKDELGYEPKIFFDIGESDLNQSVTSNVETAIQKSRTYLLVFTDSGFNSPFLNLELGSILNREKSTSGSLLFIIKYSNSTPDKQELIPEALRSRHFTDFSGFKFEETLKSTKLRVQFGQEIEKLCREMAKAINPPASVPEVQQKGTQPPVDLSFGEIKQLAREYEDLRKRLPSGDNRTKLMESIVSRMKAKPGYSDTLLVSLINSNSPGERLAAVVALQKNPNPAYLNWLAERVGDGEKPFIGYQASVALYLAARNLSKDYHEQLVNVLNLADSNIDKASYKDPNQVSVINAAKKEIDSK